MHEQIKKMWCMHKIKYYSPLKRDREGNSAICNSMDEPGGHYTK